MRFTLPFLALLAAPLPAPADTTLDFQGTTLLQFDNRFYPMSPGLLTVGANAFTTATPVAMTNCRRESGLQQNVSAVQFRFGAPGAMQLIHLDDTLTDGSPAAAQLSYVDGMSVVSFRSGTGDLWCDGAVVPAFVEVFGNSFE